MGARRIHVEIRIRDRVYPSVAEAAAALGVSHGLIYKAIKAGTLDSVGDRPGSGGTRPMPITIRGRAFANARAAAAHFGVGQAAIYRALHEGCIDRVGRKRVERAPNSRPITVCGRTWPSRRALAFALGRCEAYVHVALRQGRHAILAERVMALLMREAAAGENAARRATGVESSHQQWGGGLPTVAVGPPAPEAEAESSSQYGRGSTRAKGAEWAKDRAG